MTDFHAEGDVRHRVAACCTVLADFKWLVDAFILDFFTEDHWTRLPHRWAHTFDQLTPRQLGSFLFEEGSCHIVAPLSLLSLRAFSRGTSLNRRHITDLSPVKNLIPAQPSLQDENCDLSQVFKKRVKAKKQHEISRLAAACSLLSKGTGCYDIIDAGAGLGHLSRALSYGHGMKVVRLESQSSLESTAERLDRELELKKRGRHGYEKPRHVTAVLNPSSDLADVLGAEPESFGIVGLHTCGNLGPTLVRNFVACPRAKFLALVGCCYMKMDLDQSGPRAGFPMSDYVSRLNPPRFMSYEALEVACHATESYCDRLVEEQVEKLKVHCYRATLETLLRKRGIHRAGLRSVRDAHLMTFSEYALKAIDRLAIDLTPEELVSDFIESCIRQWKRVIAFYSLRLVMAPLVETVVQLDRLIYLSEHGLTGMLLPLFDACQSPRNYVLLCAKANK